MIDFIWHYIYWYLIHPHPVYWFYRQALEYNFYKIDKGVWFAIAIFGTTAWIGLARFFAETPGRLYGNTYFWWITIATLHIWSLPIYIVYVLSARFVRNRREAIKAETLRDRSRSEIYASAWEEKRINQIARAQESAGKRRKLPNPTALPAIASTRPTREPQDSLLIPKLVFSACAKFSFRQTQVQLLFCLKKVFRRER